MLTVPFTRGCVRLY